MTESATETVTVAADEAGGGPGPGAGGAIPGPSRSRLKALILGGQVSVQVTVQGAIAARTVLDPAASVNSGDTITVTLPPPEAAKPSGEDIPLSIVYEADEILVLDKPNVLEIPSV